jgi:nucleotide-binding universal stress UspA family protein
LDGANENFASRGREEVLSHLRSRAEDDVTRARKSLEDKGFAVTSNVAEGNPASHLLEQAEEGDFDVVAVGAKGRTTLERVLLGSVTDRIVRHARSSLIGRPTA